MIGPHEGKELELMLAGKKHLAIFHDEIPMSRKIPEEIIPDAIFAPHVKAGTLKRFSQDIPNLRKGGTIRFVCFTTPNEEWRAQFVLWLKQELYSMRFKHNSTHDEIIGKLLGYTEADIKEFLSKNLALE